MKNKWTVPVVVGAIVLVLVMIFGGTYNGLISSREGVNKASADLQSAYQRRSDLIPNLVNTVKGSSTFEQDTLTKVVDARSKATQVTLPANATPEQLKAFQDAQSGLSSSLSRLIAVAENYPDLKSTQAYQDLMVQLEGTENRINTSRNDYNNVVKDHNVKVQSFPTNIAAGMFGFKTAPLFQGDAGVEKAPTVKFDTN